MSPETGARTPLLYPRHGVGRVGASVACIRRRRGKYVVDHRDAFGVRRWVTCETKREADRELERALGEPREPRRANVDRDVTVSAYAATWLELVASSVKPRTLESYAGAVRLHIAPLLGALKVRQVSRGHIEEFVARKLADGLSRNTVHPMETRPAETRAGRVRW
jgi:hypothetical protein